MAPFDFVSSSGWKFVVDLAQVIGAAGTFFVAAVALYLSKQEFTRAKQRDHRELAETFWMPASEASSGIANWNLIGDVSALAEYLDRYGNRLRVILERAVRVLPDHKEEVEGLRKLAGHTAMARLIVPDCQRTAGKMIEVVAQKFFQEPGRLEKPTIQVRNRFGEWEDVSVWHLLGYWFTESPADFVPGIGDMRLLYAQRHSTTALPFLQELWKAWDQDSILRTGRERLNLLDKEGTEMQIVCESKAA